MERNEEDNSNEEPLDDLLTCSRGLSYLDLDEFKFALVNDMRLEPDILEHLDTCEACQIRLAAFAEEDVEEMRAYYERYKIVPAQVPAPPVMIEETEARTESHVRNRPGLTLEKR